MGAPPSPPPPPRGRASPRGRAAAPPGWHRCGPAVSGGDSARLGPGGAGGTGAAAASFPGRGAALPGGGGGGGPPLALTEPEMGPSRPGSGSRPPWGPLPLSGAVAVVGHCLCQPRSSGRRSRCSEVTPPSPVSGETRAAVGT